MTELTALVIDDDKMLSLGFSIALQQCGFTVEQCNDGTQALAEIERVRPLVITLDVHMPHVSGVEILQEIRRKPELVDTKVIMITAAGNVSYNETVNELADLVLLKPISLSQITTFVTRFAELYQAEKRAANAAASDPSTQTN